MKASYAEIKQIIDQTDWESGAFLPDDQPDMNELGYFAPSGANWCYRVGITNAKRTDWNDTYLVVTRFGEVKGFRKLWLR